MCDSVCAVGWPEKKKNKNLGCAVLYLSVFPCTHRNVEGILLFQKMIIHLLRKTENP